ncbi:desmoplakin isoform X2 [Kryptolebias marmoratus]|uniref:desmoplakin isoform X2 n=1 Tax=Kryptolebias marmoratus TaxID=37003 RepID=UPI0018ACF2C7|nr:desmoplakin isoform X2 [Kryptolebias marmoratus]
MSAYGSQQQLYGGRRVSSRSDLAGGGTYHYARSDVAHGGGGGYDAFVEGNRTYSVSRTMPRGSVMRTEVIQGRGNEFDPFDGCFRTVSVSRTMSKGGAASSMPNVHQKVAVLQSQCNEYLKKAEFSLKAGNAPSDVEYYMGKAKEAIDTLKMCAIEMNQMGQPCDGVIKSVDVYNDQLMGVKKVMVSSLQRRKSTRGGSSGAWEEPGKSFHDAMAWIAQQKRLIETAPWGDDPAAIDQQLISHQQFHSSIQRSQEMDRARDDLFKKGDKANLNALTQEWDNLQQMSHDRTRQLRDLQQILQEISNEIMWVNDREEEELMFDWGDKNVEQYIPRKQESYSKLMSNLEEKEKDLNKLRTKVDTLLKNNHPASDKIEAYRDTLQTQWSWLLQITKCIDTHLKENAAYSQFFQEINDTNKSLKKAHEIVCKKFKCNKNTSLEELKEILQEMEREKEKILDHKLQVQHLVNKSKSIVRLKPRNPEENSSGVIVKALCDFKQDQKVICKGNEAILKDNNQRSKWFVTGPGGLDMLVPSVCLIVPPPNPLSVNFANKNEQYFESILGIWNQLYINVKSLIAWRFCLMDMKYINSLTISMLSKMHPEEYRQILKNLETHYEEFKLISQGSQMFGDDDKRSIENQFIGAQSHYDKLVVELPTYAATQEEIQVEETTDVEQQQQHLIFLQQQQAAEQQRMIILQQPPEQQRLIILQQQQQQQQQAVAEEEARRLEENKRLEEERRRAELKRQSSKKTEIKKEVAVKQQQIKREVVKSTKTEPSRKTSSTSSLSSSSSHLLTELHTLRLRMEAAEGTLSQYVHICFGEDGARDCGFKITQLESVQHDVDLMREEYLHLRERILKVLDNMNDSDKAQFLQNEIGIINQRLGSLESSSTAYIQRLQALRDMLGSIARAEDIVKVHEARLTEKETTSLSPAEVNEYMVTLQNIKTELEQKKDVLTSMEAELSKASHWNSQVGGSFHRCDLMLSKYTEQVGMLFDRWRRIHNQIDTRLQDLQLYLPQLQHYKQTSTSLTEWIDKTRKKQDTLQATKIDNVQALKDHIDNQKALNTEIKAKRETVESVLRDNETCVNAIKDYETDLASYTSGLETLLNVPIKRTMLKSPSRDLNLEATQLQTRYMELLTLSGDYYKFLGQLLKNMEELKIRNTQIELLEEDLRLLKDDMRDRNAKNKSLEDSLAQYELKLSQKQDQLLSLEEVKQSTVLKCNATKDSLDSSQGQLADLNDEVERLKYLLGEEKRKTKLAEERYTQQQEEYESVLRKRQKELETVSWSKVEVEKSVTSKEHEIEQLRRQLNEEAARAKELQKEISKVRSHFSKEINNLKLSYESHIQISRTDIQRLATQRDEDTAELQLQYDRMEAERRNLEEELRRLRISINQSEELKKKAEEEAQSQRAMLIEEGRRRREMESQMEVLIRQRDEEINQYREELTEVMKTLQEKSDQLVYVTHSLEEESRRRKTTEEGQAVFEQSLAEVQVKLTNSSVAATQLRECEEELKQTRLQLEREGKERYRVEQNMCRLQGRIKDLQAVRDGLESQVENLRQTHQEEVGRRMQVEAELEKATITMTEYTSTITQLRQSQEQVSMSEKRNEEECLRLKEELEKSLKQNQNNSELNTQLSDELNALKQQLLQEQVQAKEANLRNEGLYKTIEEKSKALNENSAELQRLKEMIEKQTKERLGLEVELRTAQQDKEELLKSKKGLDDELSSQITALELQLQASERSNVDYRNLVSELSSEREKLKLEAEKIQKQVTETQTMVQSLQSQYSEIVTERDALLLKLQRLEMDKEQIQRLEEELSRIKLSLDSELRNKQRLIEESERVKRDLSYWKDQCDGKLSQIRQYDLDKDIHEREKTSLKSEIERLMRELRELEETYKKRLSVLQKDLQETTVVRQTTETELKGSREPPASDASSVIFDGVRKTVTAKQLLDCGVLDKPTFNQLLKGHKTVPEVSTEKKVPLKGTGPIAGVIIEGPKTLGSSNRPVCKMTFTEAKKDNLLPTDSIDLLLDAQAATGHIIDPRTNQKFTVEEACNQGVIDDEDKERLLAAEAAAVGYGGPGTNKPLSVFQAMKKGLIDKSTTLRLLQAQESVGGVLDPVLSVFLPRDSAIERNLIDDDICYALNQRHGLYLDPETEDGVTYMSMKRRCKVELHTGLLLLPIPEKVDPSKLVFDGVRKPVTAKQLFDCGVIDKPTFKDLETGKKTVPEVSVDKNINLKGTGPIAGVIVGKQGKMSLPEAKKQMVLPEESADLLLEAQAATGHIIDPKANQKLTVDEACAKGVLDINDRDRLLAAEAAAIGYKDPNIAKPISVFQAMKKRMIDEDTGLRLLQAQKSVGGILDPNISVFLPEDTAIKRNLLNKNICQALNQSPECYIDPETEKNASYGTLKERCKIEPHTGLLLLPITEKLDPSKLIFDGVRKPVTAKQLLDCAVIDKPTFNQLMKGEKTVPEVSVDKKIFLKGTGSIAGLMVGHSGKKSLSDAKKQMLISPESADKLLEAQAATGHIIDPKTNKKLTVEEACASGVVDKNDQDQLLAAEAAAVGYPDPRSRQPLSVFEAMKKGVIDKKTAICLLQAQESAGGILDPNLSVFLPRETAIKRNLIDQDICRELDKNPGSYPDPDTECNADYGTLKKKCKTEPHTGLLLLPLAERKDPSNLIFDGVRKPVTAKQLLDCEILDKPTFNQLIKGEKTVPEVSVDKKTSLKGTGSIAGVAAGPLGKMSLSDAKKQMLMSPESADKLLEAQAATGHIIDLKSNDKLTVEEACAKGLVDKNDRDKLLAAEAAAVGYPDPRSRQPLSVFEAMKKGVIDKKTAICLLQAQESAGGILDPNLSVFLPRETAIKRNLIDQDICRELDKNPKCYLDPDTHDDANYEALKKKCKTEPHTGLMLLPLAEGKDPSKLMFDGVRKPVSAQQLLECGVLDKPTYTQLIKGMKTVPEVSVDKKTSLKGTGSIAGVAAGPLGKMSLSDAKKQMLMSPESADKLLEAQAATGHIIDLKSNDKLTVEEACAKGLVDKNDRDKLLAAEAAAVGYPDPRSRQPLSVFEAMKKGVIDKKTAICLLQAQESAGGILDPNLSVFLPRETAIKRNLIDQDICRELDKNPKCYLDPDTHDDANYEALKKKCKTEPHTGLMLLPLAEGKDPSKLMFDGVRKPVSAQQLLECGVLDKPTYTQLIKGMKTVPEVSVDKKTSLKGTGSIAGVAAGPLGKMSLSDAKKQMLMSPESADKLLEAQAATGHIIDLKSNDKLTVEEACAKGLVDKNDRDKLLAAEAAAVGYPDPRSRQPLSVFEAMKKGVIDKKTAICLLQAQESAGGILDPNLSVFLPRETAIKRNLIDQDICRELDKNPKCYLDPDTEDDVSYATLRKKCKTESHTGLHLLPITEGKDPSKLMFDGVRKPVSAQQLLECGVLDKTTFNKLVKGQKTVPEVSVDRKVYLKGTGPIAGVVTRQQGKISLSEAKKQKIISEESADLLLEAQAATGYIIDPKTNQKLTVEEACVKGVLDPKDQTRLLAAEGAAVGYKDPSSGNPISVFEAMKKGLVDEKTALRHLQAQDSVGGILDPNLGVFMPKDTAIKHNLLDEKLKDFLKQSPACYIDPETDNNVSYGALKSRCNTSTQTSLHILPVSEKVDSSKLLFDGVRKTVTAQQLLNCGILDNRALNQLMKGEKTVSEVAVDKKVFLKGTGSIAGVAAGPLGKMSFTEAKKQKIMSSDSANMLLLAQAATGHIIDPRTNQKLTVKDACARGIVDKEDESVLLAAESAAIGYKDPNSAKLLSAGQAMKKGLIDKDTALRVLQAQESVGGILDPTLGVFLPQNIAKNRGLIDENLQQALRQSPESYLDPDTEQPTTYISLKKRCKSDLSTGLLLLPKPKQPLTIQGLRNQVSVIDLVDANLLSKSDMDQLNAGKLTCRDIEERLRSYLRGSTCIAGVYDEASDNVLTIYQAMANGLLRCGTTLELLEAQAASGYIIDPVNNLYLTVAEASNKRLFGPEFKDKLLSAEKAVTGYKMPGTNQVISLFQAIEEGLVEKGHGIRLLEAQIASGGIIDPEHSHRIEVNIAYKRGYFDEEMNKILTDESDDTKGFFDPNTEENLTYLDLKKRCITDKKTGLILLPIIDKKKQESTQKNTLRKRRVIIVDPDTGKEMTIREAYDKEYIDYETYLELSEQECEWEEITITAPDGSTRFVIIDRRSGRQYDITELLEMRIIDEKVVQQYRSRTITLTQFADILSDKTKNLSLTSKSITPDTSGTSAVTSSSSSSKLIPSETSGTSSVTSSSSISKTSSSTSSVTKSASRTLEASVPASLTSSLSSSSSTAVSAPLSPTFTKTTTTKITTITERSSKAGTIKNVQESSDSQKQTSSVSITLSSPLETVGEAEPVGAIFDTDSVEKISITEALNRGLVDSITTLRLLEAQACTGGIVNPTNGQRISTQEAYRMGIITEDMINKLKPAQKAYNGFEDVKTKRKMSVAEAVREMWLPYDAGQRFMEFQVVTGGLYDPEKGCRRSLEDSLKMGWLDARAAQKLQDIKHHPKILTCPKSKLRISYKEALDNCLVEDGTGVKMLQASSVSSRGISSPYNASSAPGSSTGSRSGSQRGSRRGSLDLGSPLTQHYSFSSFTTTFSSTK